MKHLLVCFYLVHAFLSACLVAGEDDFQTLELTDRLQGATLKYRINEKDPAADGVDTVTISYTTPAIAWSGIAVSTSGTMIGSEAVIGSIIDGKAVVKKYELTSKLTQGVVEMPEEKQTLIDTQFLQSDGETTLTYTKILEEDGEIPIKSDGEINLFLGAWGFSNTLAIHKVRGTIFLSLATQAPKTPSPTSTEPPAPTDQKLPTSAPSNSPAPGFQTVDLGGSLAGSTIRYRYNLSDSTADGKDTITLLLTVPSTGWLGIGISTDGQMLGSEAIIGLPESGQVKKYSLTSKSTGGVIQMPEEQQTLINTGIRQTESETTLTFTKILIEEGEIPISTDEMGTIFLAAYGPTAFLSKHSRKGAFTLTADVVEGRDSTLWKCHGYIAAITWGILCPLAISASVFRNCFSDESVWFNIHRTLNALVISLTVVIFGIAVAAIVKETPTGSSGSHFNPNISGGHRLSGLILLLLTLVQAVVAISRPKHHEKESDDEKSNSRKAWEVGHRLLGLVLLALSWYQIQLGLTRYHIIFEEGLFDKGNSDTDLFIFWPVAGTLAAIVAIGFVLRLVAR